MKARDLALTTIIASGYLALGFVFQDLAFGGIQVRIADALYPLIAILGIPCLAGTFFGHLIFNVYGVAVAIALGPLDLLSPFIFLVPKFLIYKYKLKAVPLHVMTVAIWIAYLLSLHGVPFWISLITVGAGEYVAEILLGVPLSHAIEKRLTKKDPGNSRGVRSS